LALLKDIKLDRKFHDNWESKPKYGYYAKPAEFFDFLTLCKLYTRRVSRSRDST